MSDTPRTDAAVFQVFDSDLWIDVIDAAEAKALERENAELKKLVGQIRVRLNKGFMRLDESQINDIVKMIDKHLADNENDTN